MSTKQTPVQNTGENTDCCNSIDVTKFDTLHSNTSLELETLSSRAKNDPNAAYKFKLVEKIFAEMNLVKTQHDKDLKDQNTRDTAVKSFASNYTSSISDVCASLRCEGELSELVLCSAKYQLMVLLCCDDKCKQDELIELVQALSLIVKDCSALEDLLENPGLIDPEKCSSESDESCETYLKDSVNCNNLKMIMMKLRTYKKLDFSCKEVEKLCELSSCNELKQKLADSYQAMQQENNEYICLKSGCSATTSCTIETKQSLERAFQTLKSLSANAKNQLKVAISYLAAFNGAIIKRNKTLAVLQYCYLNRSRKALCTDLNFDENILANGFYDIVDIVTSYGACDCSQEDTSTLINEIWCNYKTTYIECINTLYCKEIKVFENKLAWACVSTEYNECLSSLEKNAIDEIEVELTKETVTPEIPDDDPSCGGNKSKDVSKTAN